MAYKILLKMKTGFGNQIYDSIILLYLKLKYNRDIYVSIRASEHQDIDDKNIYHMFPKLRDHINFVSEKELHDIYTKNKTSFEYVTDKHTKNYSMDENVNWYMSAPYGLYGRVIEMYQCVKNTYMYDDFNLDYVSSSAKKITTTEYACVHVRYGDKLFINFRNKARVTPMIYTPAFYISVIKQFIKKGVKVYIVSDSNYLVNKFILNKIQNKNQVKLLDIGWIDTFYILMNAKYLCVSMSSFSLGSLILNKKNEKTITMIPKNYKNAQSEYELVKNLEKKGILFAIRDEKFVLKNQRKFLKHMVTTQIKHDKNTSLDNRVVHMITYGDKMFEKSKERIKKEGEYFGFDTIKTYERNDLDEDFLKKTSPYINMKRGGGYWLWKFYIIQKRMKEIKDGEYLVYIDSGCTIDKRGKALFKKYLEKLDKSGKGVMGFQSIGWNENIWTVEQIFEAFNIENNSNIRTSPQIIATVIIFIKNKHSIDFLDKYMKFVYKHTDLLTDKYNSKQKFKGFRDNRHDQSLFSVLCKLNNCLTVRDTVDSWKRESMYIPFKGTRIRK